MSPVPARPASRGLTPAPAPAPGRAPGRRAPRGRLVLLALVAVGVLAGLDAALVRLGARAPVHAESLAGLHGLLMVYGFLGTAIALERAVALRSAGTARDAWAHLAPAAGGAGTLLAIGQAAGLVPHDRLGPGLAWTVSMGAFVAVYVAVWRRQASVAVLVEGLGAVAGLVGAALWTRGFEAATVVPLWAALLVLTIVGERLELARLAFAGPGTEARVLAESCALLLAAVATLAAPAVGYPLLGLALGALVLDVAAHDVARRTVRGTGVTRLMAASMLAGYGWAGLAALVWIAGGPALAGYRYDVVVHALTVGFALSMVVAHAPVIVPAIARRPLPYHPVMWLVAGLLHAGLLVRVLAAARSAEGAWRLGGTTTVTAVLALLASVVVLTARRAR